MSNTIDADLLQDSVSTTVINALSNRFAPFAAYTRDYNDGGISPVTVTKNVQVPIISSTASTVKNPTTFVGGDTVTQLRGDRRCLLEADSPHQRATQLPHQAGDVRAGRCESVCR